MTSFLLTCPWCREEQPVEVVGAKMVSQHECRVTVVCQEPDCPSAGVFAVRHQFDSCPIAKFVCADHLSQGLVVVMTQTRRVA